MCVQQQCPQMALLSRFYYLWWTLVENVERYFRLGILSTVPWQKLLSVKFHTFAPFCTHCHLHSFKLHFIHNLPFVRNTWWAVLSINYNLRYISNHSQDQNKTQPNNCPIYNFRSLFIFILHCWFCTVGLMMLAD